jgi:sterol desaturase/sphingolipid hydroxylase (fatty acid hydroxylase superfamily)
LWNTLASTLLQLAVYDGIYYWFHRALHLPAIYPYIHKHHHKQLAPTRGTIDGINTHPFEFISGLYHHILCLYLIPSHIYGAATFLVITSLMASLNHTRWAVHIPYIFEVRDHDMHHQIFTCNYAQYVPWFDWIFGTHRTLAAKK